MADPTAIVLSAFACTISSVEYFATALFPFPYFGQFAKGRGKYKGESRNCTALCFSILGAALGAQPA